jgi:NCAIR mutase (PurE)-related protein
MARAFPRSTDRGGCARCGGVDAGRIRDLLDRVRAGSLGIDEALGELRDLPFRDLGYATVDHHRALRTGVPEVILGEPKTAEQIVGIARELVRTKQNVLVTRLDAAKAAEVRVAIPELRYAPIARTASIVLSPIPARRGGPVGVLTAGTADLPVAEEAIETLRMMGIESQRIVDVGVAGVHRLLDKRSVMESCSGLIVIAGMEGALPSVVGGLTARPVVAVPTSVGYGTHWAGLTPLFAMLASCASGVVVVNIDNGFGAAMAMGRILPPQAE